jgi:AraC-like DNA-binding protein
MVREQLLDLTAVVLGNVRGEMPRLGATTKYATLRLRAAIESQLANADANAQSIAVAAGMSERSASRLLAQEGTSLHRLLYEGRLQKCRNALRDPAQSHRSISEIAHAWGFRDISHFSHAFKARYGLAPRDYRITCPYATKITE